MSSQTASTSSTRPSDEHTGQSDFDMLWNAALRSYEEETGKELLKLPFANDLLSRPRTADGVVQYIAEQNEAFEGFRASGRRVLDVVKPIVHVVQLFIDAGAEGASKVAPGGKAIFVAVGVLLQAAKGISALYNAIESLLRKISACLTRTRVYLEPSSPPNPALLDVLRLTLVQVFIVLGIVTKYCDKAGGKESKSQGKKGARAMMQRMKDYSRVFTGKKEIEDALKELEELTDEEGLIAAADTNTVVRQIKHKVDYMYHKAVIDDLHSWLDPPNARPINYDAKRRAGSCGWFFDDQFEGWKSRKGGMYWVSGHAGAGKTIICSSVVDTLQEDSELLLAYFYFDEGDPKKQDHYGLVASLVFQIGTSSEDCLARLKQERSFHSPTYDELLTLLSWLLRLSGPAVIVIDALDECPERARVGLLQFLGHLRNLQCKDDIDIRVLVTSRPENDIRDFVSPLVSHKINVNESREHAEDIRSYISTQLFGPESRAYLGWPENIKWRVYNALNESSNGMFLWVVLQLQDLKHCAAGGVERALDELPCGLDGTYERILKRFPSRPVMVTHARLVFECVAFAQRSLSPAELAEILSMGFDSALPYVASPSNVHAEGPEAAILQTCPRLLEIVSSKTVRFIHRSVKEYLTSETLRQSNSSPAHPYSIDESTANFTLAKICLSVLVTDGPLSNLQAYADGYWYYHVMSRNENALGELLESFLYMDSPSFARWDGRTRHKMTAFHWAAQLGLYRRAEKMLERSRHDSFTPADSVVRKRDGDGNTALNFAAASRHVDICGLLLEHGALVEDTDNEGDTPLHDATRNGHLDVVRFLLEHPAADGSNAAALRCGIRNNRGETASHVAAHRGHTEICRFLLKHGALVDDADNNSKTPTSDC